MLDNAGPLPVVESGAAQLFIIQLETQWLYKVELAACIGTQANDISGVRWNFRLIEYDMKHGQALKISIAFHTPTCAGHFTFPNTSGQIADQ